MGRKGRKGVVGGQERKEGRGVEKKGRKGRKRKSEGGTTKDEEIMISYNSSGKR